MPTPSERKALWFLSVVLLLGAGARVLAARQAPVATAAERQALARQLAATDSAAAAADRRGRRTSGARMSAKRRAAGVTDVGGVQSVPPSFARPGDPYSDRPYGAPAPAGRNGFPPPSPRIDIGAPPASTAPASAAGKAVRGPVDVDRASAAELEALPRIGPALAARIIAVRDSIGGFGNLERLGGVKGIGPAMLATLAPLVRFSARGR